MSDDAAQAFGVVCGLLALVGAAAVLVMLAKGGQDGQEVVAQQDHRRIRADFIRAIYLMYPKIEIKAGK